jgi:hypothetical protein
MNNLLLRLVRHREQFDVAEADWLEAECLQFVDNRRE